MNVVVSTGFTNPIILNQYPLLAMHAELYSIVLDLVFMITVLFLVLLAAVQHRAMSLQRKRGLCGGTCHYLLGLKTLLAAKTSRMGVALRRCSLDYTSTLLLIRNSVNSMPGVVPTILVKSAMLAIEILLFVNTPEVADSELDEVSLGCLGATSSLRLSAACETVSP